MIIIQLSSDDEMRFDKIKTWQFLMISIVIKDNEKKKEFMRNLYQHAKFTDLMCHFEFDLVSKKESIKILLYVLAATIVFEPHLLVHAGL